MASRAGSATNTESGRATPVTRLATFTGLPNQSPARVTAGPNEIPTRIWGKSWYFSAAETSSRVARSSATGSGLTEHHGVTDRFDEPHRRRHDIVGH